MLLVAFSAKRAVKSEAQPSAMAIRGCDDCVTWRASIFVLLKCGSDVKCGRRCVTLLLKLETRFDGGWIVSGINWITFFTTSSLHYDAYPKTLQHNFFKHIASTKWKTIVWMCISFDVFTNAARICGRFYCRIHWRDKNIRRPQPL